MHEKIIGNASECLEKMRLEILSPENFKTVTISNEWLTNFPENSAGVYVLKHKITDKIMYVGETGNLRLRMKELLETRHHSVRRTMGENLFKLTP